MEQLVTTCGRLLSTKQKQLLSSESKLCLQGRMGLSVDIPEWGGGRESTEISTAPPSHSYAILSLIAHAVEASGGAGMYRLENLKGLPPMWL